jgi:hypothetical protein
MYGNNTKRLGTCFNKTRGGGGSCQFMVTTYSIYVHAETNAPLHLASSNTNSMDRNSSMRSTEGKLEVFTNFHDDVSCGQDVMSEMQLHFYTRCHVIIWCYSL